MKRGDRVRYWTMDKHGPPSGEGVIRMMAMRGDSEVAWISGYASSVHTTHVELVVDPIAEPATRYPPGVSGLPKPEPRVLRFQIFVKGGPGYQARHVGSEYTFVGARSTLRYAIRQGLYSECWIVDSQKIGTRYGMHGEL